MKASSCKRTRCNPLPCFAFTIFLLILLSPFSVLSEDAESDPGSFVPDGGPIQITADKLVSNTDDNNAEFIGNVRVIQGETQIDADRLQIFFSDEPGTEDASTEQSLEKLVATGHVEIKVDNKLAVANKAVYITKNRLFTLTGPGSRITSGENTITGETITFYRDDGKFTVEGGTGSRVEAVILPNESGLE